MFYSKIQHNIKIFYIFIFFALVSHSNESIDLREKFFEEARNKVKSEFVGHNKTIDEIFDSIKSWYLFKETRKGIKVICLWGMTGTGKTSIVERIVTHLNIETGFNYYDMDKYTKNEGSISYDLTHAFTFNSKNNYNFKLPEIKIPNDPVLMFDEIQKVNTLNPYNFGAPIDRPGAQIVWEILGNNGKININNPIYTQLLKVLEYDYEIENVRFLEGKERRDAITKTREEAKKLLDQTPRQIKLDLSSSLVFIAGNLDHIFAGSSLVNPEALSADELNSLTKNISSIKIKQGLNILFRPEQVARMRSNHMFFQV